MRIVKEDHPEQYEEVRRELKVLLSTAELCAAGRVKRIAEEFDLVHIDVYACVEGFFSLPCPCGESHILPAYHAELLSEEGEMFIIEAGPEYKEAAKYELGEKCFASPAFADGRIYIRGEKNLYCIGYR